LYLNLIDRISSRKSMNCLFEEANMYFVFNIAIHDRQSGEVRSAVTTIMQELGFDSADPEQAAQAMRDPGANLLPRDDPQLLLRSFLISPTRDRWCMVYPSTGWFSETQDLGVKLSQRLDCAVMVLLIDDSRGWGYELSRRGQIVDRFHAQPIRSEALKEKNYRYGLSLERQAKDRAETGSPKHTIDILTLAQVILPTADEVAEEKKGALEGLPDDLPMPEQRAELEGGLDLALGGFSLLTAEQKAELSERYLGDPQAFEKLFAPTPEQMAETEKYRGNPALIAELFGVAEDQVAGFLSRSWGEGVQSHDEMTKLMRALGIDGFYLTYQDLTEKDLSDDDWHKLIFVRPMTAVELQWYEKQKVDFPFVSPPLWLNDTT
jgi:hypothetical protein